ncbi:hypothetical protein ABZ297_33945 [Nonomuraea sp. NPDC005983]|uniref:hypothetical protein n=1 Tax=unclassified Nonomuraea TaxID=2593643 RepID=UPI003316C44B
MALLDPALHAFVTLNGIATSPFMLVVLAFIGAYLGARAVEFIPFTRRILERRAQAAAERE